MYNSSFELLRNRWNPRGCFRRPVKACRPQPPLKFRGLQLRFKDIVSNHEHRQGKIEIVLQRTRALRRSRSRLSAPTIDGETEFLKKKTCKNFRNRSGPKSSRHGEGSAIETKLAWAPPADSSTETPRHRETPCFPSQTPRLSASGGESTRRPLLRAGRHAQRPGTAGKLERTC